MTADPYVHQKKYYRKNRERILEQEREWRVQNPDYFREWAERNRERKRETDRAWYERNRQRNHAASAAFRKEHPKKYAALQSRRRARKAKVQIVEVNSSRCGVCTKPLTDLPFPDPRSTTIGHEPPLSRAVPGQLVIERPEHWECNSWKGARLDAELPR